MSVEFRIRDRNEFYDFLRRRGFKLFWRRDEVHARKWFQDPEHGEVCVHVIIRRRGERKATLHLDVEASPTLNLHRTLRDRKRVERVLRWLASEIPEIEPS